jgi:hypothetical protein
MSCGLPFASQTEPSTYAFYGLLIPFPADNSKEFVVYNIPANLQFITIPFSVQKLSNNIGLAGIYFSNTVDASVYTGVTFTPTVFSSSSISGLLSGTFPTSNYFINFVAFVKGT